MAEIDAFVCASLDFAALADVHDMKRQMQTYRGQSEIGRGPTMSVGRGAIRESSFSRRQQLIAGGRHPDCGCGRRAGNWMCWHRATGSLRGARPN